jgi:phage-related protein
MSGLVDATVQAAEYGTEEARSVISAVLKSIAMYIQQVAAWLQSVISYILSLVAQHPLAFMMFLTDVGIMLM